MMYYEIVATMSNGNVFKKKFSVSKGESQWARFVHEVKTGKGWEEMTVQTQPQYQFYEMDNKFMAYDAANDIRYERREIK
jgi:hypothetical protein